MQRLWNRLKMLVRRTRQEQEFQDEIAAHLNMDTRERIDTGSDPAEARRAAHRHFGNVLQIAEDTRTTWGWTTAEQWLQERPLRPTQPDEVVQLRRRQRADTRLGHRRNDLYFQRRQCGSSSPF